MSDTIHLPRSLLKDELFKAPNLARLFCYLLSVADDNGNLTTSLKQISKATRLSIQQVRTCLAKLISLELVTQSSTKRATQISICEMSGKSKSKQTKRTKAVTAEVVKDNFVDSRFEGIWQDWLEYRKAHNRPYKNEREAKKGYEHLLKLSNNDPLQAADIVNQTIANGWQGLYPDKSNGTRQTDNANTRLQSREQLRTLASGVLSQSSDKLYNLYYGSGINTDHSKDKK